MAAGTQNGSRVVKRVDVRVPEWMDAHLVRGEKAKDAEYEIVRSAALITVAEYFAREQITQQYSGATFGGWCDPTEWRDYLQGEKVGVIVCESQGSSSAIIQLDGKVEILTDSGRLRCVVCSYPIPLGAGKCPRCKTPINEED